ncbi:MAG: hypothetical protein AAF791_05845, partial [Bacteroidota bacterium]
MVCSRLLNGATRDGVVRPRVERAPLLPSAFPASVLSPTSMLSKTLGACAALLLLATTVSAQPWTSHRPDGHAPIGVMADHTHEAGEVMLSYRFMYMDMAGSRVGTDAIADETIVSPDGEGFMVTPTEMPMQ